MTRSSTLPSGVSTEIVAAQYRAVHAVEIMYGTPVRITDGPEAVTVLGNSYTPWYLEIGSVSIGKSSSLSIRVGNADQTISTKELAGTAINAAVNVYEVVWSSGGSQLDPVQVFTGIVTGVLWDEQTVEYEAALLPASSAGFVGARATKLCSHVFKHLRCGYGDVAAPTFTRATTGFNQSGTSSASGEGRYDYCHAEQGLCIEEACTNLCTANMASIETDTSDWTDDDANVTLTRDSTYAWTGTYSLKVAILTAATARYAYTAEVAATASTAYTASAWIRSSVTASCQVLINWYTAAHAFISQSTGSYSNSSISWWTRFTLSATSPGTAAYARLVVATQTAGDVNLWVDGVQLEQKAYPTSWHTGGATRNAETLTVPSGAFTNAVGSISVWIKLNRAYGTQAQYIFYNGGGVNQYLELYVNTSGKLVCTYGTGATVKTITSSGSALSIATNYHACVTWAPWGVILYQDGSSVGSDATAPSLSASTLYLGSGSSSTAQLGGWIDEVVFFSTALTSTQVAALAAMKGSQKLDTTTTYWLPFDGHLRRAEGPSSTTCDHTYTSCTAKSNTARWGGLARICPAIGQVVRYTVVGQQGTQQRVGTSAPRSAPFVPTAPATGGTVRGRIRSIP